MTDKVLVRKCSDYDNCEKIIFEILDYYNLKIKEGTRVLIKPNLVMPKKPESAAVTHYKVVKAVVSYVEKKGGTATIADSPGGPYQSKYLDILYRETKMTEACSERTILNYNSASRVVENKNGMILKRLDLIEPVFNCDLIINLAKLKTHCFAYYTGAVKNLFGLIPGLIKAEYHFRFKENNNFFRALIDIYEYAKPTVSIIDAIDCMEGEGPTSGNKKHVGLLLAGENAYSLDFIAMDATGLKRENSSIYELLAEKGKINDIEITGDKFEIVKLKEAPTKELAFVKYMPKFLRSFFTELKNPYPRFDSKKCVLCSKCVVACPAHILKIENKKVNIEKDKCIRCYCCHELCPKKAVIL